MPCEVGCDVSVGDKEYGVYCTANIESTLNIIWLVV